MFIASTKTTTAGTMIVCEDGMDDCSFLITPKPEHRQWRRCYSPKMSKDRRPRFSKTFALSVCFYGERDLINNEKRRRIGRRIALNRAICTVTGKKSVKIFSKSLGMGGEDKLHNLPCGAQLACGGFGAEIGQTFCDKRS